MNNITEIVFGESFKYTMKNCSFAKNNNIIKFDILFSIVNLSNVYTNIVELNKDIYSQYELEEIISLEKINVELDKAINNKDLVRVWTTHNQIDEYMMFLYVCNYFVDNDCDLSVIFSDDYDQEFYSPVCLNECELEKLINLEHKLSREEIVQYSNQWKLLMTENSDMRVIDNGEIKSVTFDYFNEIILDKLKQLGEVKTIKLVVKLVKEYHLYDVVFIFLIDRLVKAKKIRIVKHGKNLWDSIITIVNS